MKLKNLLLLPILALLAGVNINNYSKTPVAVNADTFEYEDGTRYDFSADIAQGQETPFVDKGINFAPLNEYSLFWSRDAGKTPSGEYSLMANGAYNTEIKT
ncbi:MAG: hypothetical protein HUJ61_04755, partial [Bacilli bacterium]|nr:hypothetical protein [Bacilli bacterium]